MTNVSPLDDPHLTPFLPLIYVVWADGELSAEEVRGVWREAENLEAPGFDPRRILGPWLDPGDPPSADQLQRLLTAIRKAAGHLAREERLSLARISVELARANRGGEAPAREELEALEKLQDVLGIAGEEAARLLVVARRPEAAAAEPEPAFDVAAMTALLDGEYGDVRRRVRALLGEPEFRPAPDFEGDRQAYRERVLAQCRELGRHGLGGASFPRRYGGDGDLGRFIAIFETLALGDLSLLVKFGVQFGLFGGAILNLGTARHHEKYLKAVATVALPGCFAMSETGHGSNVRDLATTARFDPDSDEFVIHTPEPRERNRKDWIGNAARDGRLAAVFAQLEIGEESYGVHAFLVPLRDESGAPLPGVEIEDCGAKMGLNGVDNGRVAFDRVRIPRENLLDRFAQVAADGTYHSPIPSSAKRFFTMLGTLVGGRISVALGALSVAKTSLAIAVRYGARRRQFGPPGRAEVPVLDYPAHQRRLLPSLATTYALHFALRDLAARYAASTAGGETRREVESLAAGLKAFSTWHTTATVQTCRECCGGQGYLEVNRLPDLKADSDVFTTFEGDNTVLLQLVAKSLLTGYREQFGELGFLGLIRFVAGEAVSALGEMAPAPFRSTDEDHLRAADFQLELLRWREDHLLSHAARRLKKRLDGGMDSFEAFNQVQNHLLATARAHVERVVLESFLTAIEETAQEPQRPMLHLLRALFALRRVERDLGWFQEHGRLSAAQAKAIREQVDHLCRELRPQAVPLVDAFAIPEAWLAPIATGRST